MTNDHDRVATAYHEAGHQAVAHLLGADVEQVTIRPNTKTLGRARSRRVPLDPEQVAGFNPAVPLVLQPLELRHSLEVDICIALAGDIAVELVRLPPNGYKAVSDDEARAERVALALAELTPHEREWLADETTALEDDWTRASRCSDVLAGELALAHLVLMRAVTRAIVFSPTCARLIEALANALLERETLGANACQRLLKGALDHKRNRGVTNV